MPIKPENQNLYPPKKEWLAIRSEVLERDGHCCKTCKVPNGVYVLRSKDKKFMFFDDGRKCCAETGKLIGWQHMPDNCDPESVAIKIVLTIAHLDHNPGNNGEVGNRPNLAALCQLHHLRYDLEHHKQNAAKTRRAKLGNGELFSDT